MQGEHNREPTDAQKADMSLRGHMLSLCSPLWWESEKEVRRSQRLDVHRQDSEGGDLITLECTKVRFGGGNLKATYDFAKKAAKVADEHFSSGTQRS